MSALTHPLRLFARVLPVLVVLLGWGRPEAAQAMAALCPSDAQEHRCCCCAPQEAELHREGQDQAEGKPCCDMRQKEAPPVAATGLASSADHSTLVVLPSVGETELQRPAVQPKLTHGLARGPPGLSPDPHAHLQRWLL